MEELRSVTKAQKLKELGVEWSARICDGIVRPTEPANERLPRRKRTLTRSLERNLDLASIRRLAFNKPTRRC